ncbi:MAG: acyl carrier protein [Methylobacterium sp.]|uniref:acyl carrier protein n=1 Tax=Methylobacterium sp. TaxID=409 RepID=UPI0025D76AED|nr:acyl carrier protein [Methylobacterium sp.]MBX9933492.1 acyl carrier protein [Methylobacterium sp.]
MSDQSVSVEQWGRMKAVMSVALDTDMGNVDMTTPTSLVPGWNSVSITVLVLALEEEFGIEMPLEDVFKVATVGDLARQVADCVDAR